MNYEWERLSHEALRLVKEVIKWAVLAHIGDRASGKNHVGSRPGMRAGESPGPGGRGLSFSIIP